MSAQHPQVRRAKLSFMHWPAEWLWIAFVVAVAMLVFVGLFVETGRSLPPDPSVPGSSTVEPARSA